MNDNIPTTCGSWRYSELKRYLALGKNATRSDIDRLMARFGVAPVGDRWPRATVWAGLFGVRPVTEDDVTELSEPLWPIARVARETGIPVSTIRKQVAAGTFAFTAPIQLGAAGLSQPRSKRWIPARIRTRLNGLQGPLYLPAVPASEAVAAPDRVTRPAANGKADNAFAHALTG